MLDIFLLFFFGFKLHKLAIAKGLSPKRWVFNFVSSYLLLNILVVAVLMFAFGKETFTNPEKLKAIIPYLPITILIEIGLYLIYRYRLSSYQDVEYYDENDFTPPPPQQDDDSNPSTPDLSYFR